MGFLIAMAVGLVLVGGWGFAKWYRHGGPGKDVLWILWVREIARMCAWLTGAAIVFAYVFGAEPSFLPILGMLALVSVSTVWVANRTTAAVRESRVNGLRSLIVCRAQAASRRASLGLRQGARVVAPTGWSEFRIGIDVMDRVLAPRTILLAYGSGLAILPVLMAWIFISAVRGGSVVDQRVLSLIVGYNALLVVSCITTAVALSLLILTMMRFARVLLVGLDIAGAFRVVATWTGYGTAAGVVTAAMLPVLNQLLPLSTSPGTDSDLTATISPQLLIDIPAAGAIVGYGIGLTVSVVVLCRRAENLIIRWLLAPAIFVIVLVALGTNGIDPRGLYASVSRSVATSTSGMPPGCNANINQFEPRLADTPWVLQLLETCSPPFLVEGGIFIAGTSAAVMLLALVLMAIDFRRGVQKLSERSELSEAR